MSEFKVGDRVRIDESRSGDEHPYTGVGVLLGKGPSAWKIELEWMKDPKGRVNAEPGDTYHVFEEEIVEVIND